MVTQYNVPKEEAETTYEVLGGKEFVLPLTECDREGDVERVRLLRKERVSACMDYNLEFTGRDSQ